MASYDYSQYHEIWLHHCRNCWGQPSKTHYPLYYQVVHVQHWNNFQVKIIFYDWYESHPPVWDHSTLLWDLPEGQLMLLPPNVTRPPVQKNLWPSLANRFLNSCSFAGLSRLTALIPLDLQKASPWLTVKSLQPILQLSKKFCPPNWWFGLFPPPHRPRNELIFKNLIESYTF